MFVFCVEVDTEFRNSMALNDKAISKYLTLFALSDNKVTKQHGCVLVLVD